MNALESVVGGHDPLDGRMEEAQTDAEVIFTSEIRSHFNTSNWKIYQNRPIVLIE